VQAAGALRSEEILDHVRNEDNRLIEVDDDALPIGVVLSRLVEPEVDD
jgi:hypothetical protein